LVSWYEKFRNAMEYHEEEVIIRASIERILRRRLLLGGSGKTTAEPLVRELIWGGYFPDDTVPQSSVQKTEEVIDLYLQLRHKILGKHRFKESTLNEWIYHLMSSEIESIINPNVETESMNSFMFQVLRNQVHIVDDERSKDVQVYIAVRKAFSRDDLAFLRFYLFKQYFGELSNESLESIADNFVAGFREINKSLSYKRKEVIYNYAKRRAAVFLILEDVLRKAKMQVRNDELPSIKDFAKDKEKLSQAVFDECAIRYKSIRQKVRTAVIRSVLFILATKLMFAFAIEGSYERFVYGKIIWSSLAINTGIPPLLMIVSSFFIRVPDNNNSKRILSYIETLLHEEKPQLGGPLTVQLKAEKPGILSFIFTFLWFLAFVVSFGLIFFILTKLHFNLVSQFVFAFFLTVVSFLTYRISLTSQMYTVLEKHGIGTIITDFFFMPIVRVGRELAQTVQSINFLLY